MGGAKKKGVPKKREILGASAKEVLRGTRNTEE